MFGMEMNSFNI
jgi:vacuolar-type H+-ATPase subunit C/Vma6